MTDLDRCTQTYPHPAHRRFGLKDCPGVPITPANAPTVPDVPAPASTLPGTVRGVGIAQQRLEMRVGDQLRALEHRLGQLEDRVDEHLTPSEYDPADDEDAQAAVQNLLDDSTRAFAAADTSSERVEVIRDLLDGWYAAWPKTAVTDEHEGIAWQLASMISVAEARASELPGWVLKLVAGLDRYEAEHPELFRFTGDGYTRWECPAPLLNLVPAEVRRQAEQTGKPAGYTGPAEHAHTYGVPCPARPCRWPASEHPPAEMVWLGDLSGYFLSAERGEVVLNHRCGWEVRCVGTIPFLANLIVGPVEAHRDAGCNPHED